LSQKGFVSFLIKAASPEDVHDRFFSSLSSIFKLKTAGVGVDLERLPVGQP